MAGTDRTGWQRLYQALGDKVQLIGDDLFTTNPNRIREGIAESLANAVLIKLNQIGTVTENINAIRLTQSAGWNAVVSARSGETEDAFIAHLAVATDAGKRKVGSFSLLPQRTLGQMERGPPHRPHLGIGGPIPRKPSAANQTKGAKRIILNVPAANVFLKMGPEPSLGAANDLDAPIRQAQRETFRGAWRSGAHVRGFRPASVAGPSERVRQEHLSWR